MDEEQEDPYRVLGVTRDADDVVIRAAWKAQVRRHHPDIVGPEGAEETARINAAYNLVRTGPLRSRWNTDHPVARPEADTTATTAPPRQPVGGQDDAAPAVPEPDGGGGSRPAVERLVDTRRVLIRASAMAAIGVLTLTAAWVWAGAQPLLLGTVGGAVLMWASLGWRRLAGLVAPAAAWYLSGATGAAWAMVAMVGVVAAMVGVWQMVDLGRVRRLEGFLDRVRGLGLVPEFVAAVADDGGSRVMLGVEPLGDGDGRDITVWRSGVCQGDVIAVDGGRVAEVAPAVWVSALDRLTNPFRVWTR